MKRIIRVLIILMIPAGLYGQLAPVTNQYILNPLAINPACAGNRGVLSLAAIYGKQWMGINGSPGTLTLSADAPVYDDRIGLGLTIVSDKIGVTKENHFITNYAYRLGIGKGTLSFGLAAGVITTNTAWSDLVATDEGDDYFMIDSKPFVVPHFSFGAFYSNQGFFAGFSLPKIFTYEFDLEKNKYQVVNNAGLYNYLLYTGYEFRIADGIKLLPSTLLSLQPENGLTFDINAHVSFRDRFILGASYKDSRSLTALFQMQVNNQLRVAYSYSYELSSLGKYTSGSHMIMLRYEFRYKVEAVNSLVF